MYYYYTGVPSWSWYYPFYYSPMIMDIIFVLESSGIDISQKNLSLKFSLDAPQDPYLQLMLILSPGNSELLPEPFARLMLDDDSPIKDCYPWDFEVDPFGGNFEHDYIALLPFIDVAKLK